MPIIPLMFRISALLALILTISSVAVSRPQPGAPLFQHTERYSLIDDLEEKNDHTAFPSSPVHVDVDLPCSLSGCDLFRPSYWFTFEDSYTTTGFDLSGPLPSVGNPLGNPPYPGHTGGGGANWVDFLTTIYNRSLVLTYDLAKGGATINSSLVTIGAVSLEGQVNMFLEKFAQKPPSTPWDTIDTLFSVWIGINDVGLSYSRSDFDAFSDTLLDSYTALIHKLLFSSSTCFFAAGEFEASIRYSMAGARFFLFINVPPVDRSPLMLERPASDRAKENAAIKLFNDKLQNRILLFISTHPTVRVWKWDSHASLTAILDDPTKYGFQDSTSYGNNAAYVWGNNYHVGSSANKIFAQQINNTFEVSPL